MAFPARVSHANVASINVTPLVDVLLVLLIIFMITAPILTHRLSMDLPQGRSHALAAPPVTLALHNDGTLYWNDMRVTPAQLERQLSVLALDSDAPALHIEAQGDVAYERVATVLADARTHGISRIAF